MSADAEGSKEELSRLERSLRAAYREDSSPHRWIPLLESWVANAPANLSDTQSQWALLSLAQLLLQTTATAEDQSRRVWRAMGLCRRVLRTAPLVQNSVEQSALTGAGYATLGLSATLLGHYQAARSFYYRALLETPNESALNHNLGHLLETQFTPTDQSLRLLGKAYQCNPGEPEIAASYALALARRGDLERAVDVLAVGLGSRAAARSHIRRWLRRE